MTCAAKPIRITVDLNPQHYQRLKELKALTDAASKAAVIRNALLLYSFLASRCQAGALLKVVPPPPPPPPGSGGAQTLAAPLAAVPLLSVMAGNK